MRNIVYSSLFYPLRLLGQADTSLWIIEVFNISNPRSCYKWRVAFLSLTIAFTLFFLSPVKHTVIHVIVFDLRRSVAIVRYRVYFQRVSPHLLVSPPIRFPLCRRQYASRWFLTQVLSHSVLLGPETASMLEQISQYDIVEIWSFRIGSNSKFLVGQ